MATIEELERQGEEIVAAESAAVQRLIDEMRDIAVELPEGSQLAIRLAKYARALEGYVHRNPAYATNTIHGLWRDLRSDEPGAPGEEAED